MFADELVKLATWPQLGSNQLPSLPPAEEFCSETTRRRCFPPQSPSWPHRPDPSRTPCRPHLEAGRIKDSWRDWFGFGKLSRTELRANLWWMSSGAWLAPIRQRPLAASSSGPDSWRWSIWGRSFGGRQWRSTVRTGGHRRHFGQWQLSAWRFGWPCRRSRRDPRSVFRRSIFKWSATGQTTDRRWRVKPSTHLIMSAR